MVTVQLSGGLGNQMFQYAAALGLASVRGTDVGLDVVSYFDNQPAGNTPRGYALSCYRLAARLLTKHELRALGVRRRRLDRRRLAGRLSGTTSVFRERGPGYLPEFFEQSQDTYLVGHWQDERYFAHVRAVLVDQFTPTHLSDEVRALAGELREARNAVSMHVRRGDYVTSAGIAELHGVLDNAYYVRALRRLRDAVGSVTCYVFSDDPEWCARHLTLDGSSTVVAHLARRPCEDMYLMRQCKHHIIANSSFGWWGAWLNPSAEKIVVAPAAWYRDRVANQAAQVVPPSWITV